MGQPIAEARGQALYAAASVEWYAEEAKRIYGETFMGAGANKRQYVLRQPVGPAYAITPWNFPAAMVTRKVAPALAAGCVVIVKPAEQAPLTALLLARDWEQAGGPAATLQVLPASNPVPASEVMLADRRIRRLTFTGSTEVGRILARQSTATLKRVSLELGGHAPFLVFEDADIDLAVGDVMASKFRNAGKTCVRANRIYVQGLYQAADGWVTIACPNDGFWKALTQAMGCPELAEDPRTQRKVDRAKNSEFVNRTVNDWTLKHTKSQLAAKLGGAVPFGPVQTVGLFAARTC